MSQYFIHNKTERKGENQKDTSDISQTLQERHFLPYRPLTVWSGFVYWFKLFIIQTCTLMDDSTFASRTISLREFTQKFNLRPSGSHPSIKNIRNI